LHRFAALDFLIGNTDRHAGNFMRVVAEEGRAVAIDHGYAFPAARRVDATLLRERIGLVEFRSVPAAQLGELAVRYQGRYGMEDEALRQRLLSGLRDEKAWKSLLDDYQFSAAERVAFEARRQWLIKHIDADDLAAQFMDYRGFGFAPED
jgi:hypothetical protein